MKTLIPVLAILAYTSALPDFTVHIGMMRSGMKIDTRYFAPNSCAVEEKCVVKPGHRRLLHFNAAIANAGTSDVVVGDPRDFDDIFEWSPCHRHHHFTGLAHYTIREYDEAKKRGRKVLSGHKQSFCMMDSRVYDYDKPHTEEKKYSCAYQGIQANYMDVYGIGLDCQWLDITGLPDGTYSICVKVNTKRYFREITRKNNHVCVVVEIKGDKVKPRSGEWGYVQRKQKFKHRTREQMP